MKIAIIGDGALGCLFSSKLSQKNDVILMTYTQEKANIINAKGLQEEKSNHEISVYNHLKAYASGTYNKPVDIVLILVKAVQTAEALKQNLDLIGEKTLVLTLQNGLGNYETISKYIKDTQLILGTTNHNSVSLDTGKFFHSGVGITSIGSHAVPVTELKKICDLFSESGFECTIVDNIGYLLWKKLFVNLAINSFTYITLTPMGFISENDNAVKVIEEIIFEATKVANAEGYDFKAAEMVSFVKDVAKAHPMGYSSMSQDRKRGFRTEIDFINGAVVKLAQKHNIPTPYNKLIVDIVHAIEDADQYNKTLSFT